MAKGSVHTHTTCEEFFRDSSLCNSLAILPPALIRMKDALKEKGFTIKDEMEDIHELSKEIAREVKHG